MDAAKNEIAGHIEYRTDLFRRSTIENFARHFEVGALQLGVSKPFCKPNHNWILGQASCFERFQAE